MDEKKSNSQTYNPPDEFLILQQWNNYWIPSQNQQAIKKLIERKKTQSEYDEDVYNGKDPNLISKNIMENKLDVINLPNTIPSWTQIDENGNEIFNKAQILNPQSEVKIIINESEIGILFRDYFENIFKTRFALIFLMFSIVMLIGINIYQASFWLFKTSPFINYFESNLLILLYLALPTIYALITAVTFGSYLSSKVKPSKWHFFDIIIIVIFPLAFYLFESFSDLFLMRSFFTSTVPPTDLQILISIYSTWNSFIILTLAISMISYAIIPCTPKGRLLYALLKLEFSMKSSQLKIVKKIPKYFHETLISLNDLLMKHFNITIDNLNEIEGAYTKNLLYKGIEDLVENLNFSEDREIIEYFAKDINLNAEDDKKSEKKIGKKALRNALRDSEYLHNLNSIKLVIEKLNLVSEDITYVRTSIKQQFRYRFQKIISILVAFISFILSSLIPIFQ